MMTTKLQYQNRRIRLWSCEEALGSRRGYLLVTAKTCLLLVVWEDELIIRHSKNALNSVYIGHMLYYSKLLHQFLGLHNLYKIHNLYNVDLFIYSHPNVASGQVLLYFTYSLIHPYNSKFLIISMVARRENLKSYKIERAVFVVLAALII
jgi:hypothetical protein